MQSIDSQAASDRQVFLFGETKMDPINVRRELDHNGTTAQRD